MVACYQIDDGTGTTVSDYGPNNFDGALGATAPTWETSPPALNFSGSGDYVNLGDIFDPTNEQLTFFMVINTAGNDLVIHTRILGRATAAANGYRFAIGGNVAGDPLQLVINNTTVPSGAASGLSNGTWASIAVVYDGADLEFYKDGGLNNTAAQTGAINSSSGVNLYLGTYNANGTPGSQDLVGKVGWLVIYSRAVDGSEITTMHCQVRADRSGYSLPDASCP